MTEEQRHVEHAIDIGASLEDVWRMLSTGEGLAAWFGTDAVIEPRVGGAVEIGWGGPERIVGRIDAFEPAERLRVVYVVDGAEVGAEEWLLAHDAGTTRVRLIHSLPDPGVEDWEGYYGDYRRGWALFLASLRFALEDAVSPFRETSSAYVPAPHGREATWRDLTDVVDERFADMTPTLVDVPNSLLLTRPDATLLCDLEGSGDGLVCYVQAATHGDRPGAAGWRAQVVEGLAAAIGKR